MKEQHAAWGRGSSLHVIGSLEMTKNHFKSSAANVAASLFNWSIYVKYWQSRKTKCGRVACFWRVLVTELVVKHNLFSVLREFVLKLHVIFRGCSVSPHIAQGRIDYQYLNCLLCDVFTWKPSCCAEVRWSCVSLMFFDGFPGARKWSVTEESKTFSRKTALRSSCLLFSPLFAAESLSGFVPRSSLGKWASCLLWRVMTGNGDLWPLTLPLIIKPDFQSITNLLVNILEKSENSLASFWGKPAARSVGVKGHCSACCASVLREKHREWKMFQPGEPAEHGGCSDTRGHSWFIFECQGRPRRRAAPPGVTVSVTENMSPHAAAFLVMEHVTGGIPKAAQ